MITGQVFGLLYVLIGTALSIYWFRRNFYEDYKVGKELAIDGNESTACLMMAAMMIIWPIIALMEFRDWFDDKFKKD